MPKDREEKKRTKSIQESVDQIFEKADARAKAGQDPYYSGSIRISQSHNTMFCFGKCLQEVFMDAPAALVERAGAAVSSSFKATRYLQGIAAQNVSEICSCQIAIRPNNREVLRG